MPEKYRGVDTRELLLSKAVMAISAGKDFSSLAQYSIGHNADTRTDIGLFYAKIESNGFGCGFNRSGKREHPLLLARKSE
jgi:hypothetical protein